jgi:hypothetical protein
LIKPFVLGIGLKEILVKSVDIMLRVVSFNGFIKDIKSSWVFLEGENFSIELGIEDILSQLDSFVSGGGACIDDFEMFEL